MVRVVRRLRDPGVVRCWHHEVEKVAHIWIGFMSHLS